MTAIIQYSSMCDIDCVNKLQPALGSALTDPAAGNDLQYVSDKVATVTITTVVS